MNEAQLDDLIAYLKFPSVSTDSRHAGDVQQCAGWLRDKMVSQGLDAAIHEGSVHLLGGVPAGTQIFHQKSNSTHPPSLKH